MKNDTISRRAAIKAIAEDELYIIRDRVYLRLWFCKARSPKEAWQKYEDECRSLAIAWGEEG